jgi:hypothetical protein
MKNLRRFFQFLFGIIIIFAFSRCGENGSLSSTFEAHGGSSKIPHLEKQGTATRLVVEGKPFLMLSGELHNSTCGGFASMKPVWKALAKKNLNSVIATVSWELIEPEEGKFDFALVDSIITGARKADLKLGLIWFASWKNAASTYIPSWVKKDYEKYPRVKDEQGKSLEILSTFGDASCEADAKAFTALMRHIKKVDAKQQTVVLIQVENEMGILDNLGSAPGNARRDFSDQANIAYYSQVPKKLMDYLVAHKEDLFPELYNVWKANGFKTTGSWEEIFGKSELRTDKEDWQFYSYYTEELFMAWNYARYVEKIASEGKSKYPIPMYVNAWLKQPFSYWPGRYPSGGPLPQVIDIWRAAAPSIDFISPDIYTDEFVWACREYTRSGNPLFIPETIGGQPGAARVFYVLGEYSAGCFAPFGIDGDINMVNDPLDDSYKTLQDMSSFILENQGRGTMKGILVDTISPEQEIELGDYFIKADLAAGKGTGIAGGIIVLTAQDEFIVAGKGLDVFFMPKNDSLRIGINAVDEGTFKNGNWIPERRLNGDETHASTWSGTGVKLPAGKPGIQKVSLYHYK